MNSDTCCWNCGRRGSKIYPDDLNTEPRYMICYLCDVMWLSRSRY